MNLYRYQTQLRIADSRQPSGYYYWLNGFFFDEEILENVLLSFTRIRDFWIQVHTEAVQLYYQRYEHPVGSGSWTTNPAFSTAFGAYPVEGGYSPFQCVYMRHLVGGIQVGYSRLRLPVLAQDLTAETLHTDLIEHIEFWANFALVEAGVTSKDGVPIDEFRVSPRVMLWQYRQGGERRRRVYVEHP